MESGRKKGEIKTMYERKKIQGDKEMKKRGCRKYISSIITRYSEVFASEILENLWKQLSSVLHVLTSVACKTNQLQCKVKYSNKVKFSKIFK